MRHIFEMSKIIILQEKICKPRDKCMKKADMDTLMLIKYQEL